MKILHLCTYPINKPRHGGQLRVNAIETRLTNAGHTTIHMAVYPSWAYPDGPKDQWMVDLESSFLLRRTKSVAVSMNLFASDYIFEQVELYQKIVKQICEGGFNVFMLEQPWLWPLLKRIRQENTALQSIPVVYSSQNIDCNLFEEVIRMSGGLTEDEVAGFYREAYQVESDCIQNASLTLAVTENDKKEFIKMGGTNVQVFPNGIAPQSEVTYSLDWQARFNKRKFALFVSSPFLPNSIGVVKYLTPAGFLPPNRRIVIGGMVGQVILENQDYITHVEINNARFDMLGKLEPGDLAAVYQLASVIVLPIIGGAGSNLKTAEAIYSQKPILATSYAMRGYDEFLNYPNLIVEDDPGAFKKKLVALLDQDDPWPLRTGLPEIDTTQVLWENRLKDLPNALMAL